MICPICHKHKQQLHAHLTRFHKLSKDQILSLFEPRYCRCAHSCGTQIFPWANFASGHNGFVPLKQLHDCECGCREQTYSRFIPGHNKRVFCEWTGKPSWNSGLSKETDSRIAQIAKKDSYVWTTEEYRNKQKATRSTPEYKTKAKENVKKQWQNEDYRSLMSCVASITFSETWKNPVFRENKLKEISSRGKLLVGQTNPMFGKKRSEKTRQLTSEKCKWLWANDENYVQKIRKSRQLKPNRFEAALLNILQSIDAHWQYVGDFSLRINGKNPDFILKGTTKLIEAMGCYFHNCKCRGMGGDTNWPIRKQLFKHNGYECIAIWEHEMSDIDAIMQRIKAFTED